MPLVFLRRLVFMVIVDGVVIVVVVEHEPFHQLVEILLKVLLDRCSLPNCCKAEEKAKAGLSHLCFGDA